MRLLPTIGRLTRRLLGARMAACNDRAVLAIVFVGASGRAFFFFFVFCRISPRNCGVSEVKPDHTADGIVVRDRGSSRVSDALDCWRALWQRLLIS